MDKDKIKLSLTKYQVKSFQFIIGKEKIEVLPSEIVSFTITEDYDNFYFPYFEMVLSISNSRYRKLVKNSTKIKANISIYKGKFKGVINNIDTEAVSFKKAINGKFKVFLDNETPNLSDEEEKQIDKNGDQYGQLTTFKIALYPDDYYKKYDLVVNGNFLNVTLADMVGYILTKTKIKNVLMSPPSNYKKYKQFILTPISTCEQLDRICNTYAIHSKGSIVFFGLDRLYIIDKAPKCTTYAKNEYKITYVIYSTESKSTISSGGCFSSSKGKYNVLNASKFTVNNDREVVKKSAGKNIVSVNVDGKITKTNKKSTKVTKVVVQNEGASTVKSLKRDIVESKRIITTQFSDIDINMVTPNKQFIISVEGAAFKKYNGKYRLSKAVHAFKPDGDYFQVESSCEFRG